MIFFRIRFDFLFPLIRQAYAYACSFSVSTFNGNSIRLSKVQPDPFIHIIKTIDLLTGIGKLLYPGTYLIKPLLCHPDTVIPYIQDKSIFLTLPGNGDRSLPSFILDPVIKGILHKGLDRDLRNFIFIKILRYSNFITQDVLISDLLDLQIASDMGKLLPDRDNILALIQTCPEEI